jgi:signal transduction histidine kinase
MLEVCDTGPGIPPQSRERIFEEFQRLPETSVGQPGAGLGLAIVRRLVQLLNGRIELESEVGSGTCFRVILPMQYA